MKGDMVPTVKKFKGNAVMYTPITSRNLRDAIRAGHRARADAFASFLRHLNPFS